jgi:hypothetical protein
VRIIAWPLLLASLATCQSAMVLGHHPEMRIIAVASNQNYSFHYRASINIHSTNIEASEEGILSTIRTRTHV